MDNVELARVLLIAGGGLFCALGAVHVLASAVDVLRPTFFAPLDRKDVGALRQTEIQLAAWFGRRANLWDAWLGFNLSHGVGMAFFGLCFVLLGVHRFDAFQASWVGPAMAITMSALYLLLAFRFWFFVPATGIGLGLLCLVTSAWLA